VRDLKLDLLFNLSRHPVILPKNQPIDKFHFTRTVESKASSKSRAATAAACHGRSRTACSRSRSLFEIRNPRSKTRDRTVPVVQRIKQGFPKAKLAFHHFVSNRLNYANYLLPATRTGSFVV